MDIEGKGLAKVVRLVVGPGNGLLLQLGCEIQPSLSAGFCIVTWLDLPLPPPPLLPPPKRCLPLSPGATMAATLLTGFLAFLLG